MNEEEQQQSEKQITDAKAHQASKDVLSTGAKAAGTYFGGAAGGKAVDAISKTAVGDKILDGAAGAVNSLMPEPVKKDLADNQKAISGVSKIADSALTANPGNLGPSSSGAPSPKVNTATPEALSTDNRGYNPYLEPSSSSSTSSPL